MNNEMNNNVAKVNLDPKSFFIGTLAGIAGSVSSYFAVKGLTSAFKKKNAKKAVMKEEIEQEFIEEKKNK